MEGGESTFFQEGSLANLSALPDNERERAMTVTSGLKCYGLYGRYYAWLLQNYANPGDKILDTHLGSGSSRIAAYKMGFDFYGTEIDKEYFDAQEKRFREECLGEIRLRNGKVYVQKELFEL